MQLKRWLEKEDMSVAEFARRCDTGFQNIWRYLHQGRTPRKPMRKCIEKATGGQVKPSDWFRDE